MSQPRGALSRGRYGDHVHKAGPVGRTASPAGDGRQRKRVVDEVASLIDAMPRAEITIKGAVIHERLAQGVPTRGSQDVGEVAAGFCEQVMAFERAAHHVHHVHHG